MPKRPALRWTRPRPRSRAGGSGYGRRPPSHVDFSVLARIDRRPEPVLEQRRAVRARHPLVRGVGPRCHGDAALLLVQPVDIVAQAELRASGA